MDVTTTAEGLDTYANELAGISRQAGLICPKARAFALDYGPSGEMADARGRVAAIRDDDAGSPGGS